MFAKFGDKKHHIVHAYRTSDWNAIKLTASQRMVRLAFKEAVSNSGQSKFDWIVKIDTDIFLRPSSFKRMLQAYDPHRPTVLSVGGKYGNGAEGGEKREPHVTGTEGFFCASSKAAVELTIEGAIGSNMVRNCVRTGRRQEGTVQASGIENPETK